jgi:hypothetical protein
MTDEELQSIRARCNAASPEPWISMREGNQYLECSYMPTAKLVGASRVDGLPRPWNPHAMISFMKMDAAEVSRFKDADADFISNSRYDIPTMLDYIDELISERDRALELIEEMNCDYD